MRDAGTRARGILEVGVASVPMAGETVTGDHHVIQHRARGVLVAVLDALGHGPDAAASAQRAVTVLAASADSPLPELIRRCHIALTGRRGVVASLAAVDAVAGHLTWAGVGNVEGVLIRAAGGEERTRSGLVTRGGIIGSDLPEVRPQQLPIERGDVLILATDGVRREFVDAPPPQADVQLAASELLARYGKGTDDALILVARYLGPADDGR